MSIKKRLLGAFLLILCLTGGVAAVGSFGLSGYARRVDVSSAGQAVGDQVDALALATERAVASGDAERLVLQEPLARVAEAIEALRRSTRDDGGAIERVVASIAVFRQNLADYAAQERERAALVASRLTLISQFGEVAAEIATAQGEALRAAADTAKAGRKALTGAAVAGQLMPFLGDALAGVREATVRFGFTGSSADLADVRAALDKLQMIAKGVSRRRGAEEAAAALLSTVGISRDATADAETFKAEAPDLMLGLGKGVQDIQTALSNTLSAAITGYDDQEFRLGAATTFRESALQLNTLAIQARLAEQTLVGSHDPAAAATIATVAEAIKKASQELVYRVTEPATEQKLRALIAQIEDYKAGLKRLTAAQEKQAGLLQAVNAATQAATAEAQSLTVAQLQAMEQERYRANLLLGAGVGVALVMGLALALAIGRGITKPLQALVDAMGRLAGGDTAIEVPGRNRRDELREVAAAVAVFRDNALAMGQMAAEREAAEARSAAEKRQAVLGLADSLETIVTSVVELIGTAAHGLKSTATDLKSAAEGTHRQASAAANASGLARSNVQAVAVAAEQLSASISDISRKATLSAQVAARAVADSDHTNARVAALTQAAEKIETVVALIQRIASQTNLLALNATIEAARAGSAGVGFAVVASEVKQLAHQTADATADIAVQISAIQQATQELVSAIAGIARTIDEMGAITAAISAAVEQQGQATQSIARNIQDAAAGTADASDNITRVSDTAQRTGDAAQVVLSAAGALAHDFDHLRGQVRQFLQQVVNG